MAAKNPKHNHVWKWAHGDDDSWTRIIYDDNEHEADVLCEGCGAQIPGEQYCAIVAEQRKFLHLEEKAHVAKLQSACDAYVKAQTENL